MLLHRKNESRDASSRSLSRYAPLALGSHLACRIAFDPEEKLRIDQHTLECGADPGLEAVAPARVVERQERSDILVVHRAPIGAARQAAQDLSCAARFL